MIQLVGSNVEKINFKANDIIGVNFKVPVEFSRGIGKIDESNYYIRFIIDIKSTKEFIFPFDLYCSMKTVFYCEGKEDDIRRYLSQEGTAIAYANLKNVISNLTASAMVQPLMIPQIDIAQKFNELFVDIESENIDG